MAIILVVVAIHSRSLCIFLFLIVVVDDKKISTLSAVSRVSISFYLNILHG